MLNEAPQHKSMEVQLQVLYLYVTPSRFIAHNQGVIVTDKHNRIVVIVR